MGKVKGTSHITTLFAGRVGGIKASMHEPHGVGTVRTGPDYIKWPTPRWPSGTVDLILMPAWIRLYMGDPSFSNTGGTAKEMGSTQGNEVCSDLAACFITSRSSIANVYLAKGDRVRNIMKHTSRVYQQNAMYLRACYEGARCFTLGLL